MQRHVESKVLRSIAIALVLPVASMLGMAAPSQARSQPATSTAVNWPTFGFNPAHTHLSASMVSSKVPGNSGQNRAKARIEGLFTVFGRSDEAAGHFRLP